MRDRLAEHLIVLVGMSVDVDQGDRPVNLFNGAEDGPGQRVVAAERQGRCRVRGIAR